MNSDNSTHALVAFVLILISLLIGNQIMIDRDLTRLCLKNGYDEQRRKGDDMYCVKRGKLGETIVINAKDLK